MLDLVHGSERVPATLLLPPGARSAPVVLLLHGFSSSKERMVQSVGRALQRRGIASLALDLPFHGERDGGRDAIPYRNPLALVTAWTTAVREARAALEWLAAPPEADAARIGALGYSLGGFRALLTTPYAALVRRAVDPLRAVRKLRGRPLLLVNGRRDTTTRPAQAERLFAYAEEPKELRWYEGGHWPPASAIDDAAQWMAERLRSATSRAGRRQAG